MGPTFPSHPAVEHFLEYIVMNSRKYNNTISMTLIAKVHAIEPMMSAETCSLLGLCQSTYGVCHRCPVCNGDFKV